MSSNLIHCTSAYVVSYSDLMWCPTLILCGVPLWSFLALTLSPFDRCTCLLSARSILFPTTTKLMCSRPTCMRTCVWQVCVCVCMCVTSVCVWQVCVCDKCVWQVCVCVCVWQVCVTSVCVCVCVTSVCMCACVWQRCTCWVESLELKSPPTSVHLLWSGSIASASGSLPYW